MRTTILATVMVSLTAAACGGSTPAPAPAPTVQVPEGTTAGTLTASTGAPVVAQATPYQTDLEAWCNAPSRAPGAATASKEDRPRILAQWVASQLKTDKAADLLKRMATLDPASRSAELRKELDSQGFKACPFLDEMAQKH